MELSGLRYVAADGESFDSVAMEVYGDEKYAAELLNANPALAGKMVFEGGEEIQLPVVEVPEEEMENAYMPDRAPWKS